MKHLILFLSVLLSVAFISCNNDDAPKQPDSESQELVEWIKQCVLDDKGEIAFIKNEITDGLYAIPAGSAENAAWFVEELTHAKLEGDAKTLDLGDGLGMIRISGSEKEGVYNTLVFNVKDIPQFTLEVASWEYINNDNTYGQEYTSIILRGFYICDNCSNLSNIVSSTDGKCPYCGFSYEGIEAGLGNAKVGDLYCITKISKTGYVVPFEKATDLDMARCIGAVIYAGHHPNDKSDYSATGIGSATCHGYAIAKSYNQEPHISWGPEDHGLFLFPDYPRDDENNYWPDGSEPDNLYVTRDWSGYLYTTQIIDKAGGRDKLDRNDLSGFPATYVALNGSGVAPVNSSGWFLPSMGQLAQAVRERNSLSAADIYWENNPPVWSSNTAADFQKVYILYFYFSYNFDSNQVQDEVEYNTFYPSIKNGGIVRSVIAF